MRWPVGTGTRGQPQRMTVGGGGRGGRSGTVEHRPKALASRQQTRQRPFTEGKERVCYAYSQVQTISSSCSNQKDNSSHPFFLKSPKRCSLSLSLQSDPQMLSMTIDTSLRRRTVPYPLAIVSSLAPSRTSPSLKQQRHPLSSSLSIIHPTLIIPPIRRQPASEK